MNLRGVVVGVVREEKISSVVRIEFAGLLREGSAARMGPKTLPRHDPSQYRSDRNMFTAILALAALAQNADGPIRLLPENPRYFQFRGEPAFLITSGEHYGAVLNLDFDHEPYLDELHRRGFNQTRTFAGTYREVPESFNIRDNTLGPKPGRYQSPWIMDGDKYDLDRFDPAYFERLRSFVSEAGQRGIVVELVLFCPFYEEPLWKVNPMNAANNVNEVGDCPREEVYTLQHPDLLDRQLAFVSMSCACSGPDSSPVTSRSARLTSGSV